MASYKHQVLGQCTLHCNDCTTNEHFSREVETDDVTTITNAYMRSLHGVGHDDCDFNIWCIGERLPVAYDKNAEPE